MIETTKVDLSHDFDITFVKCDCPLDFHGYFVENVPGEDDLFHLVKVTCAA
jgi:hypothetical protein